LRGRHLTSMWNQKTVRWSALVVLIIAAIIAWRFVPILHSWITMHDRNPGSGQFLLPTMRHGIKQVFYMLAFSEGLTVPVALAGVAGFYLIWRRDKPLGLYLASLAFFPLAFLTLITLRTPVSQYYLLPSVPAYFLGVGVFLDRLFAADWGLLRPRWLLPATITIIMISAGVPTLLSEHMNGRRYDFRGMAQWLAPRMSPGDAVFSDQPMVMAHYLSGAEVQRLRPNTAPLEESFREVTASGGEGALWIVAPARGHTFRTDLKAGGLIGWIYDHCQLRNITGKGRVDFRAQYLHLYRCPPTEASPRTKSASALDRDRVPLPR
jgi:hypothetical protein